MYKTRKRSAQKNNLPKIAEKSVLRTPSIFSQENVPRTQKEQPEIDTPLPKKPCTAISNVEVHRTASNIADQDEQNEIFNSQMSVPASQPPTQKRYLSQRGLTMAFSKTQFKSMSRAPNSYFEMTLSKSGADIEDTEKFVLNCDPLVFVNNLASLLRKHNEFPSNIKTFCKGFEESLNKSHSERLLIGCMINIPMAPSEYESQESMTMNFMMISFLQEEIVKILFEKIEDIAKKSQLTMNELNIFRLLLSQLKFATNVKSDIYNKIIEIYESASSDCRKEIILSAEFSLGSNRHDDFVQYLLDNTRVEDILTIENIKTFDNLHLSLAMQKSLAKKIIQMIKRDSSNITILGVFIKFLLNVLNEETDDKIIAEQIIELRMALEKTQTNSEKTAVAQRDVFINIKQGFIRSKKLGDIWLKSIQALTEESMKSVDILIFLMLMTIREEKILAVEKILRRQIESENIKINLIFETKNHFLPVFKIYADTLLKTLYKFLKDKNSIVIEFAKNCICIIFSINHDFKKNILNKLVDFACNNYSQELTVVAFELLNTLNDKFFGEIQNFGSLLLPLLDRIYEMSLKQSRTILKLLCSVAYAGGSQHEDSFLQEHINLVIKKQLGGRNTQIQQKGIIGMVHLINNIVRTENDDNAEDIYDLNESYQGANDLPEGKGKEAAGYILRIYSATSQCVNTLELFYEEIATALAQVKVDQPKIDRHFLVWFCDLVTLFFQDNFIRDADEIQNQKLDIDVSIQMCRNFPEDAITETEALSLAINMSELVFASHSGSHKSLFVLPSLFNTVSVLHKIRYSESLEAINAVLGCGVVLPTILEKNFDETVLEKVTPRKVTKVLDLIYHLTNWFRAVIGSFASQEDDLLRKKLLFRLRDVIECEELVRKCLLKAPLNYNPPLFQNNNIKELPTEKKGRPQAKKESSSKQVKKGKNDMTVANDTEMLTCPAPTQNLTLTQAAKQQQVLHKSQMGFDFYYSSKEIYWQMNQDIILILRENLDIKYPQEETEIGSTIGLKEFKFLMQDIVSKLESIRNVKRNGNDLLVQNVTDPETFIEQCQHYSAVVFKNLEMMKKYILEQLLNVEGILSNANLYTDQMNYIKVCSSLCLRFFAGLFSYGGYDDSKNENELKKVLLALSTKKHDSIDELVANLMEQFLNFEPSAIDMKMAYFLYKIVNVIKRFPVKSNYENKIRIMCKTFLCRKWYQYDGGMAKGANFNIYINELIHGFLKNSNVKRLKEILVAILSDCKSMKGKDDIVRNFPNINKLNFSILFKRLCDCLIDSTKASTIGNHSEIECLLIWENCTDNLSTLQDIIQAVTIPKNYGLYIRSAHTFIKLFLQYGLPLFEKSLKKNPERFNTLLKRLQYNMRFLHNLCCHSKVIQNNTIVSQIPFVRETVEKLVYQVKACLAVNSCVSAFWMGPLKNRDIQGEEIVLASKSPTPNNEDNENEDDTYLDDTTLDDEHNAGELHKNQSTSDVM